jgi:hypothetical protein
MQHGDPFAQDGIGIKIQFSREIAMTIVQRRHGLHGVGRAIGNRLQHIGHAGQRRHHDQHPAIVRAHARQPANGVPSVPARHRGAAELEYGPAIAGQGHDSTMFRSARRGHEVGILIVAATRFVRCGHNDIIGSFAGRVRVCDTCRWSPDLRHVLVHLA